MLYCLNFVLGLRKSPSENTRQGEYLLPDHNNNKVFFVNIKFLILPIDVAAAVAAAVVVLYFIPF